MGDSKRSELIAADLEAHFERRVEATIRISNVVLIEFRNRAIPLTQPAATDCGTTNFAYGWGGICTACWSKR